jgi:hypothetical protein
MAARVAKVSVGAVAVVWCRRWCGNSQRPLRHQPHENRKGNEESDDVHAETSLVFGKMEAEHPAGVGSTDSAGVRVAKVCPLATNGGFHGGFNSQQDRRLPLNSFRTTESARLAKT